MLAEQAEYCLSIANVQFVVRKVFGCRTQSREIPGRVAWRPEELAAHVVVHADDIVTLAVEMFDCL